MKNIGYRINLLSFYHPTLFFHSGDEKWLVIFHHHISIFYFFFIHFILYKKISYLFILENFCNFSPNQLEITNKFVLFQFDLLDLTFSFLFSGKKID
jgi:hypothetical protein